MWNIDSEVNNPANQYLFNIRESELLDDNDKNDFHTCVAQLLYLGKRTRLDILLPVTFLASRIQFPTVDDRSKLIRVLKYIKHTKHLGITFECDVMSVIAYIDASYGCHDDGRSHSGKTISLGRGAVYSESTKQRLTTKASTEAELVSLSDGSSQIIWTRDFMIHQGYQVGPATIYQDNMSTIALVKKGKPASKKTRHINIRYFFIKDRVEAGEIKITYCPTEKMVADLLTKPIMGEMFIKLRKMLLND
jgi:hypothetical protein